MLNQALKSVPTGESGVYCMFDLDGEPAYAGQTSNLRSRLRQHFIRQDSSVVSYGRLDIWDIAFVEWWTTSETDLAENVLISEYQPYLNFESGNESPTDTIPIDVETPGGTLQLVSEDELEFRSEPYNRSKQKLEHLLRMIDKIKLAGHSEDTKRTVYEHQRILEENISQFLGVERRPNETDYDGD
jgi:excinuclease UvrABC nuclease subunit